MHFVILASVLDDIVTMVDDRLAPEAVVPAKSVSDPKPRCPAMRRIGVLISFRKSDHEAGSLVAEFREVDCRDARLVDLPER